MIATSIVRFFQLLFSVIVLALSITAIRWQEYGKAPAATGFNAFAGAWGVLISLIGFAAIFITSFPGLIMSVLDVVAFIFLLAGGIAYSVQLRGVSCGAYKSDDLSNPVGYDILNGGYIENSDGSLQAIGLPFNSDGSYNLSVLQGRCNTALADDAFLYLACIASLVAGILAIVAHRRGNTRHSAV